MRGSYQVRVANRAVSYEFTVRRNITIIQGDSATGKTTLIRMIRDHAEQGEDSGVTLSCARPCVVVGGSGWRNQLDALEEDSIVFIDEGNRFVASEEFAQAIRGSGHYYVIATREPLYALPYSVTEIYGVRSSGKYNSLQPVYHEFYRIYAPREPKADDVRGIHAVICEDGNSGFQFFAATCHDDVKCAAARGNSNIAPMVRRQTSDGDGGTVVIADGAAFGAFMNQLGIIAARRENVWLYLPESFEWLILQSGLVDDPHVREILNDVSNHIDSRDYLSWERFFTALLIEETKDSYLRYRKAKLNPVYLQEHERNAIIQVLPRALRQLFE